MRASASLVSGEDCIARMQEGHIHKVCVCVYIPTYIHTYIHKHIMHAAYLYRDSIYLERERESERERDREGEREREIEIASKP